MTRVGQNSVAGRPLIPICVGYAWRALETETAIGAFALTDDGDAVLWWQLSCGTTPGSR